MNDLEELLIIGAGDHGRGTLEIARACNLQRSAFEIVGFLDDNREKVGSLVDGVEVLGTLDWLEERNSRDFSCIFAIANCEVKKTLADRFGPLGLKYANLVHPSSVIASGTSLGEGNIINAGVVVAFDTRITEHTTINLNATVGHDCIVGPYSTVAPGANIAGRVILEEGVDVGLNSTIGKGLRAGAWSQIGPGTVVLKDLEANIRYFGNPARPIPRLVVENSSD